MDLEIAAYVAREGEYGPFPEVNKFHEWREFWDFANWLMERKEWEPDAYSDRSFYEDMTAADLDAWEQYSRAKHSGEVLSDNLQFVEKARAFLRRGLCVWILGNW